ncbi:MAG: TIGR03621 family F420-dependent LLM class oxidoreductase [Chloroflexota bacterium]
MRPLRFLAALQDVLDGPALTEHTRRAEAMGYHGLLIPDHLAIPQLSPVPAMTAIALATTTLRTGTFVLNNDLRHPAVLAQDLASIDVLSGGRLDVALGAGWREPEYAATGIPFEPQPVRVARLAEAVTVLKGCFADGPFSFAGEHYTITEYDALPKPVQRPGPPLMIGGGGRRTLELAARAADVVGLAPRIKAGRADPASITFAGAEEKIGWVRDAAGERFADLELNTYPSTWPPVITDDPRAEADKVIAKVRDGSGVELTFEDVMASPHLWIGTVESLAEKVHMLRERLGITSFLFGDIDELAPVVARLAGS